jgi:hypothetical protein
MRPPYLLWHREAAGIIREVTGQHCKIELRAQDRLARTRSFELVSASPETIIDWTDRERGGRTTVVPLGPPTSLDNDGMWVSWYEEWLEEDLDQFGVSQLSATFYWGRLGRQRLQILRAEWATGKAAPPRSAQPHWQFDREQIGNTAPYELPRRPSLPIPQTAGELEELEDVSAAPAQDFIAIASVSRLHLGMAGWTNHTDYPECWRRDLAADQAARAEWLRRVFEHAADQLSLTRISA